MGKRELCNMAVSWPINKSNFWTCQRWSKLWKFVL